jgi:GTPase SAR1 family protein
VSEFSPEIDYYLPGVVKILVGTKSDLRSEPGHITYMKERDVQYVTKEEAEKVQRKINAVRYVETSAKTGENVKFCFESTIESAVLAIYDVRAYKKSSKHKCVLL